jgi:peptidoglycan/LPS O-acetylase OafA/YrhL
MSNNSDTASGKEINFDIEALRGYAAIFVVWHHAINYQNLLDPNFTPTGILSYAPSGHFCVLIFFLLSGYVIGLSNKQALSWATSWAYLKKRLVRLYPIYIITLLFALSLTDVALPPSIMLGNVAMLQGLWVHCDMNPPGWSLHYEMLYYLLFIFVSSFRLNPFLLAVIALLVGISNIALYPVLHTPIITAYCYGFIFWLIGLGLSRQLSGVKQDKASSQVLLSCLLFLLCIDQYNVLLTLAYKLLQTAGVYPDFPSSIYWAQVAIHSVDFAQLLPALIFVLVFIGKKFPYKLLLLKALVVFSGLTLLYVAKHLYAGDLNYAAFTLPTCFFLSSLLCLFVRHPWLEKIGKRVIQVGIRLGSLSYAIYLIHYPLLIAFNKINYLSGTWQTFAVRFALLMALTIVLSFLLEKLLQPRIKAFFLSERPSLPKLTANVEL